MRAIAPRSPTTSSLAAFSIPYRLTGLGGVSSRAGPLNTQSVETRITSAPSAASIRLRVAPT